MSFKIIEKQIQGKSIIASKCEDRIIITDNFVCLVDGATSKSNIKFESKTQGVISCELIEKVIFTLPINTTITEFISEVNKEFNIFYAKEDLIEHMYLSPIDRLNASVIIYSDYYKEVWLIGDCQAIIEKRKITNPKIVDSVLSNLRAFIIEGYIKKGMTVDEALTNDIGREKITQFLIEQSVFQNSYFESIYSYGVLDGFPIYSDHIKVYKIGQSNYLILATDGYPEIYDSLEETEKYLDFILKEDPLCYKIFKSTKGLKKGNLSFDDRAYVKIELTPKTEEIS